MTPLTLEERAEFLRLHTLTRSYPGPGDYKAWTDVLLVDWFRDRGVAGLPRDLAYLLVDSHADFDMVPEKNLGYGPEEAWGRIAGAARGSEKPLRIYIAFLLRFIRESQDFGELNGAFRALGSLIQHFGGGELDDIRIACQQINSDWRAIIGKAEMESPEYRALRESVQELLPTAEWEAAIPRRERLTPVVRHEKYECYYRRLVRMVQERYEEVFSRPLDNGSLLTAYLFGYDARLLGYSMGQSGKYGEDPRQIYERYAKGEIPPWKPFDEGQTDILAARIGLCMNWILDVPRPDTEQVVSLARKLVEIPPIV